MWQMVIRLPGEEKSFQLLLLRHLFANMGIFELLRVKLHLLLGNG